MLKEKGDPRPEFEMGGHSDLLGDAYPPSSTSGTSSYRRPTAHQSTWRGMGGDLERLVSEPDVFERPKSFPLIVC